MVVRSVRDEDLWDLIERYTDGTLDQREIRDLDARLRANPDVLPRFVLYMELQAQVAWNMRAKAEILETAQGQSSLQAKATRHKAEFSGRLLHRPGFWIAVSLLMAFFLGGLHFLVGEGWRSGQITERDRQKRQRPMQEIVALVTDTSNCQWAERSPVLEPGDGAPVGKRYELADGLVKLVFGRQTRCLLEGPIVFRVVSADVIHLERGRLAAEVPTSAKGFTVRTPWANVIDLGTEFGVEVDETGPLAIHVFKGMVRVEPMIEGPAATTVAAGQAVQLLRRGTDVIVVNGDARPVAFRRHMPMGPGGGYAESRFEEGRNGWTATPDAHLPLAHKTNDGSHGGYVETYDDAKRMPRNRSSIVYFSFIAPSAFCGNHINAYGKTLSFDLRISGGTHIQATRYCELQGAEMMLRCPVDPPPNNNTWVNCKVPLRADSGWVRYDIAQPRPAKEDELKAVLSDLRRVLIPGEFYYERETVGLDNVVLGMKDDQVLPTHQTPENSPALPD